MFISGTSNNLYEYLTNMRCLLVDVNCFVRYNFTNRYFLKKITKYTEQIWRKEERYEQIMEKSRYCNGCMCSDGRHVHAGIRRR